MANRMGRLRMGLDKLTPDFISRHFTWLSATILGLFIGLSLFLVLRYVPGVTANTLLNGVFSVGSAGFFALTGIGAIITVHRELERRGWISGADSKGESTEDLSKPARAFVKTDEEVIQAAMNMLEDYFSISERGEISLHPVEELKGKDHKGMLYMFAAFVAYEANERDSPWVYKPELKERVGYTSASANVFMSKMGEFVDRNWDPEDRDSWDELEEEDVAVKLNVPESYEAAKYIIGERSHPN